MCVLLHFGNFGPEDKYMIQDACQCEVAEKLVCGTCTHTGPQGYWLLCRYLKKS